MRERNYYTFWKKVKNRPKNPKNCPKIGNFKFWTYAKSTFFKFFSIFFFLNHPNNVPFHLQKKEFTYLTSLYLISQKPQKTPNSRKKREYLAEFCFLRILDPKFGISDQKRFRISFQTCWDMTSIFFCCTVLFTKSDPLVLLCFWEMLNLWCLTTKILKLRYNLQDLESLTMTN